MAMRLTTHLAASCVLVGLGQVSVVAGEGNQVETFPTRSTRLYVRTIPPGAEIKLDGEHRGFSDRLFKVPPGVRKMTVEVELDGHYPEQQEVEIRGGWIRRVVLELEERPKDTAAGSPNNPFKDPPDWGPEQATGPPDTQRAGDFATAWASLTPDGQPEWLLLEYARPVRSAAVHVHETYNPGALSRITVFDPDGKEVEVWKGKDPTTPDTKMGVSKIPVEIDFKAKRIKLYLDSPRVKGWNEIDAVGLVDEQGKTHWAASAEASSTYADYRRSRPRGSFGPLPPPQEVQIPDSAVRLGHVDDSAEGKRSLGGSGHAVEFGRPDDKKLVVAVQIYASRYGYPRPPDEDFHVYLLDQDMKAIKDLACPYATIQRTRGMRWYTLNVPPTEVPEQFHVALSFNPHQTKGIYLGFDRSVRESHSYVGLPNDAFEPVREGYDWMVRAIVSSDPDAMKNVAGVTLTTIAEPEKRQEEKRAQLPLSSRGGVDTLPPVVVETVPRSGDTNVDPSISEIRVTFSKEMTDGSWSWSQISDETFPQLTEEPRYLADKRTCVLRVKLQAAKTYVSWLNSAKFGNFKDAQGRSAVPYLLIFETRK